MRKTLAISVIINILFIFFGGYVIHKKGGIDYIKRKLSPTLDRGAYYYSKKGLFEIMPNDTNEIIFLGNSITDWCDWYELFGKANIKNRGIGGDVVTGVIERIDEVVSSKPKKIFLMIGINDLGRKDAISQILTDYEKLINLIKEKSPATQLYIQSILPTYNLPNINNNDIVTINTELQRLTMKYNLIYVNLFDLVKNKNNELDTVYTHDGIHVNEKGYLIWKKAIENYVNN